MRKGGEHDGTESLVCTAPAPSRIHGHCTDQTFHRLVCQPEIVMVSRCCGTGSCASSHQGQLEYALVGLFLAGVSDWADGYVAKTYKFSSTFGSYLDPLADKVGGPNWRPDMPSLLD